MVPAQPFGHKLLSDPASGWVALLSALFLLACSYFNSLIRTLVSQLERDDLSPGARFDLEESRYTANASRKACTFFFVVLLPGYFCYVAVMGRP